VTGSDLRSIIDANARLGNNQEAINKNRMTLNYRVPKFLTAVIACALLGTTTVAGKKKSVTPSVAASKVD
jgi:hypothetical protein